MNFLTLAACCLLGLAMAMRSRENSNVLVPSNDVNFYAKVKKLMNDNEADPEDFSDNEIANLGELYNPKVEKVLHLNLRNDNQVNDDQNKNNEENRIEVNETSTFMGDLLENVDLFPTETNDNQSSSAISDSEVESFSKGKWKPSTEMPETTTAGYENYIDDDECLFGKSNRYLLWVDSDGRLIESFIDELSEAVATPIPYNDYSYKFKSQSDYDKFARRMSKHAQLKRLTFLSLAYNNLERIPFDVMAGSNTSLEYLSLAGNNYTNLEERKPSFRSYVNLHQLDLRNCALEKVWKELFSNLPYLEFLFLSDNRIMKIEEFSFNSLTSLLHLDLAYNAANVSFASTTIADELELPSHVFKALSLLETLDLSRTKIVTKSIPAFNNLPGSLRNLSLCYAELPTITINSPNITRLDISGNHRLAYTTAIFNAFARALKVLVARDSNIKALTWLSPLTCLEILDLSNNNINSVDDTTFSRMNSLMELNLEKNTISNWYQRIFDDNQRLEMLNLRENKLTQITNNMKEDLSSVKFLALGKNDFECNCHVQQFMKCLFFQTENADLSIFKNKTNQVTTVVESDEDEENDEESVVLLIIETTTFPSLALRNRVRPEYDIISRTYQRYYAMVQRSSEALQNITSTKTVSFRPSSRSIVLRKNVEQEKLDGFVEAFKTALFDYNDDYQCMNVSAAKKQEMLDFLDCENTTQEYDSENNKSYPTTLVALTISIPTILGLTVLLFIIYWKFWYIRYFFTLCKNSAILTFMDNEDDGKKSIVKGRNDEPVSTFLYDVFVSYCNHNREWVLNEFIPNVEKREEINVCLHERDFQVGFGILENIVSCMDRSRCLLLLVSGDFLLSQWCQFEMNLAQHRLIETRREKLILVFLEDIPTRRQSKTLKYLMRTKTYIKWPNDGTPEDKKLFWKRLKKSIISSKWENDTYGSIV